MITPVVSQTKKRSKQQIITRDQCKRILLQDCAYVMKFKKEKLLKTMQRDVMAQSKCE